MPTYSTPRDVFSAAARCVHPVIRCGEVDAPANKYWYDRRQSFDSWAWFPSPPMSRNGAEQHRCRYVVFLAFEHLAKTSHEHAEQVVAAMLRAPAWSPFEIPDHYFRQALQQCLRTLNWQRKLDKTRKPAPPPKPPLRPLPPPMVEPLRHALSQFRPVTPDGDKWRFDYRDPAEPHQWTPSPSLTRVGAEARRCRMLARAMMEAFDAATPPPHGDSHDAPAWELYETKQTPPHCRPATWRPALLSILRARMAQRARDKRNGYASSPTAPRKPGRPAYPLPHHLEQPAHDTRPAATVSDAPRLASTLNLSLDETLFLITGI
jgi:hypothetical protein